jgi:predicted O-methyltransferase YrrM
MIRQRQELLLELEKFGADHDARTSQRQQKMLNITPDTGAFLAILVRASRAGRILEIGTSNGYSTIWLADAAEAQGASVVTVEALPAKADLARENFARAGLAERIDIHLGAAADYLHRLANETYDFIFLDADRSQYLAWWPELERVLAPGGLLVVDNAVSHAAEMAGFVQLVAVTPGFQHVLVPIGKGELVVLKIR